MIREISFRAAIISKEFECHQPVLRHVATCTVLAVTKAVVQETFTESPKVPSLFQALSSWGRAKTNEEKTRED